MKLLNWCIAFGMALAAHGAAAQTYPSRPVKIVVPATTGGAIEDVRSRLIGAGIEIQGGTPGEFAGVIKAEIDKWGRIVKEAGIQPE